MQRSNKEIKGVVEGGKQEMKVKTTITDAYGLKEKLNEIGWENVLQILPDHHYDGTLFIIIYKER